METIDLSLITNSDGKIYNESERTVNIYNWLKSMLYTPQNSLPFNPKKGTDILSLTFEDALSDAQTLVIQQSIYAYLRSAQSLIDIKIKEVSTSVSGLRLTIKIAIVDTLTQKSYLMEV
jgi:hypothetical protein